MPLDNLDVSNQPEKHEVPEKMESSEAVPKCSKGHLQTVDNIYITPCTGYGTCRICRKEYQSVYKNIPWVKKYKRMRDRIKLKSGSYHHRNFELTITRKEVKALWFKDKAYLMKNPSIDRIDSTIGYTKKNCRFMELNENQRRPHAFAKRPNRKHRKVEK